MYERKRRRERGKKEGEGERERQTDREKSINLSTWHKHTNKCTRNQYTRIHIIITLPFHLVECIFSEWISISKPYVELVRCCFWANLVQYVHHSLALSLRPHLDG
jgi:hypothetical protein